MDKEFVRRFLFKQVDFFEEGDILRVAFEKKVGDLFNEYDDGVEIGFFKDLGQLTKITDPRRLSVMLAGSTTWNSRICALLMPVSDYSEMIATLPENERPFNT